MLMQVPKSNQIDLKIICNDTFWILSLNNVMILSYMFELDMDSLEEEEDFFVYGCLQNDASKW